MSDIFYITYSKRFTSKYYLIVNGWVGDWLEKCTISCIKENRYLVCEALSAKLESPCQQVRWHYQDPTEYVCDDKSNQYYKGSQNCVRRLKRGFAIAKQRAGILLSLTKFEEYANCNPYILWLFD